MSSIAILISCVMCFLIGFILNEVIRNWGKENQKIQFKENKD